MGILYILLGSAFGAIITYLRLRNTPLADNEELDKLKQKEDSLDLRIKSGEEKHQRFEEEFKSMKEAFDQRESELHKLDAELSTIKAQLEASVNNKPINNLISQTETHIENRQDEVEKLEKQVKVLSIEKSELEIEKASLEEANLQMVKRMENLEKDLIERTAECDEVNHSLLKEKEEHQVSKKKIKDQKTSIQALGTKFNSDFQNMGVKMLEELESRQKTTQ